MKYVFYLILILNFFLGFSQDLLIDLELVEIREKNRLGIGHLISKDSVQVPYLEIKYTNISDQDVYFKRIEKCLNRKCLPIGIDSGIYQSFKNDLTNLDRDTLNIYKVFLDSKSLKSSDLFEIVNKKTLQELENQNGKSYYSWLPQAIDSRFQTINKIIELQNILNEYYPSVQLNYFKYEKKKKISVLKAEEMLHENQFWNFTKQVHFNDSLKTVDVLHYSEAFIFLQNGHSYTERINLIGLKLLGQSFEFDFKELKFKDFEEVYNFELKKMERFYFPKHVDGYIPLNEESKIKFNSLKIKL